MKNKILNLMIFLLLLAVIVGGYLAYNKYKGGGQANITNNNTSNNKGSNDNGNAHQSVNIGNYDQCVATGYAVTGSSPKQCTTPDGKTFTEDIGNAADKNDLIRVSSPLPNDKVVSPLKITGEARGYWFFEASFPVKVYDENGKQLGVGIAQAKSDWMTDNFVPFEATVTYSLPETMTGTLILEKDNPSGQKQNDDSLRVPVSFGSTVPMQKVSLYYYDANKDKDSGGKILCSSQGLVPVERNIVKTDTIINDTIKLLIQGKLTDDEIKAGIDTDYPLYRFELVGSTMEKGVLTLTFNDPERETIGGSCRVNVLKAQILATAKQFPQVKTVEFQPDNLFQP